MKFISYKDWPFFWKSMGMATGILAAVGASILFYFIPLMESSILEEKRASIKNMTNVVYSLLTEYEHRASTGEFTVEEAQERAMKRVSQLRYGSGDYFWINDMQPRVLMHPIKPELNGKDVGDMKDASGKKLFIAFVDVAKKSGEGFVDYLWPKPGADKPQPKISYVKLFPKWDWIIGTGVYIDDLNVLMMKVRIKIAVASFFSALLLFGISFFVVRVIVRPLTYGVSVIKELSSGDLSLNIENDRQDEIGLLLEGMKEMASHLSQMIGTFRSAADKVAVASTQLSSSAERTSEGVSEQSGRASQIAAASSQMSKTVVTIAHNASEIAHTASETLQYAGKGKAIFITAVNDVQDVAMSVTGLSGEITALGDQSKRIGEIVKVIKEIADQTNLLALNAAIEAARAGEQGRGFAVVADEVRKLAEKTSRATSEIGAMIGTMQSQVEQAVNAIGSTTEKVIAGAEKTSLAVESLDGIVGQVGNLQSMVEQIASATEEMSAVSESISSDIETVATVSSTTAESAEQIAESSRALAGLSQQLKDIVHRFKIIEG